MVIDYDNKHRGEILSPIHKIYNDTWSPADQELTLEQFTKRLDLAVICFDVRNCSVEAIYGDMIAEDPESELFCGHSICVPVNYDGSFGKPYLAG